MYLDFALICWCCLAQARGPCVPHSSWPLSPPALQHPTAVCSCPGAQTIPGTLVGPGTPGVLPQGWCPPGELAWLATSCPHLSIFRSKMLFSCEKENGSHRRGSWEAAIRQLLPQAVLVQLQPPGSDASRSQHWDSSQPQFHREPLLTPKLTP